ncbi:hypothetical protein SUGI_0691170 [Cryptomeria japonica]|nr:hypothetical protein SUGI_0691170 [Cryptomeria japonica]
MKRKAEIDRAVKVKSARALRGEEGETSGKGVNASAVMQPLSPNLFRVMRIVPDKQDYSFVEKVQLPQDEILSLCNKLVPSSASAYVGEPPRVSINFSVLNQQCLPALGFYGDKNMIIHIFRKESLVDDCVLAEMERRLLEPGLYVSLPEMGSSIVVFYWHEGEYIKLVSRKNVSCNFIRYLVELCDSVYVCVNGSYPFEALAASAASASSKATRTRRIQVSSVKNSENDVEFLPGYKVGIDRGEESKKSSNLNNHDGVMVFCEGYHRCCFLTTEKRVPRKTRKIEEVSMKASEFRKTLESWSAVCNVDYTRLSNEQFIVLLQNCQPQEFDNYSKFKESLKTSKFKKRGSLVDNDTRPRQAEDEFVRELKKKMSTRQVELNVKVAIEEKHPIVIVYKACELTPMRKDVSEFNSNHGCPIVPKCGVSVALAAINPQRERLFKVVILKSGVLMVFIHNITDSSLYLYRCPKIGVNINDIGHPIITFRRGLNLLAVDEDTRSMALYEKEKSRILIYKFDESFQKVYGTGIEVNLESFKGSKNIIWMQLIPGKMELLMVDDTNRARVAEIHERPMMKAKHICLPLEQHSTLRACVSADGYFFLVFRQLKRQGEDIDVAGTKHSCHANIIEIYILGDTMSYLKTIHLNARECSISDLEQLRAKITIFGLQSQLLLYSPLDAPNLIHSHVLKTVLATEAVQLQQVDQIKAPEDETEIAGACPYLGYIYHIFDKFATTPRLFPHAKKCITFKVVLEFLSDHSNDEGCLTYLETLSRQLKAGKDKDFSGMDIQFEMNNVENCPISAAAEQQKSVKMGMWVRKLVCLVPIQIARAENNGMVALKDGLQIPPNVSYIDSVSLSNSIRFGFYDAVLSCWKGKIKVISSMGKQSSGKSYLLNHLSGSLLDVAGGRCTDGVWMTIATGEDGDDSRGSRCLYVLLDFEGLGSFERSEQEDMLLSVLNAAVSNITIFNKKDFHLDKDTESAFRRFQSGINLLKQDKKLFKGLFYIAIKDVNTSDVEDLMQEFHQKIYQICSKSQENFILKMYDGKIEIAAMAPHNRSEYYRESLSALASTVTERIDFCYDSGFTFLRDLKLIIAQIAAKDWTSIDSKRVAVTVDNLRRNLMSAVHTGCLSVTNTNEELRVLDNFDTHEEVPDFPVVVGDSSWNIRDSGLYLSPCTESETSVTLRDVFSQIRSKLDIILPRNASNGKEWHSLFESFLEALADRRHARVQQWISSNTTDFSDNDEVQRLQLEADVALGKVKQGLSVCGCECSDCFWRCVKEKGHEDDHSCMGSRFCTENCSYCAREGDNLSLCGDLAGHERNHNCKKKNHTCGGSCYLHETSSNCNQQCSLAPGHPGQHKCNSPQHMCSTKCSLPSCNNPCAVAMESNHQIHQCHERYCQSKCMINGCSRTCGVKHHFHDLDQNAEHLCGNEHACTHECEMPGICEIFTELVKQTRVFQGQRGSFEYEILSEQNGLRKFCCIPIPPYEVNHEGPHVHTKKEDSVHNCDIRCLSCGYFCQLPIDHLGLHDTVHGNMKNVRFISEGEDFDIEDRKYKWGETGEAEMCNMYCKKQGRGHIHLVTCPGSGKCTGNLYDGSRHETVKYGPDVDVPKDEMTHETYWQSVRFVDPCTKEESEDFDRCNHYCKSEEHETDSDQVPWVPETLVPLWQSSIAIVVGLDGVYEAILRFIQVRLRSVSDDSVSVVLFDTSASVALEMEDLEEGVVDRLLPYYTGGATTYSSGLDAVEKLLMRGTQHHSVNVKKPVVIFLSDGGNNGGGDPLYYVDKMKRADPRMILHTMMFGNDPTMNILIEMAKEGVRTFERTLDEIQLARSFENLAESLKPQVAALM